ncbi:MAG: methyltransferase domain-containing protein [Anaerolineales bacterium]
MEWKGTLINVANARPKAGLAGKVSSELWQLKMFRRTLKKRQKGVTGDRAELPESAAAELPFPGGSFDLVLTIDVHEHIHQLEPFNCGLARITRPGGRVIVSTPNDDPQMLAVRIKQLIGMTPEVYGHRVIGFRLEELESQLRRVGLHKHDQAYYVRFFTEMLELIINFAYVSFLAGRGKAPVKARQIAPQSEDQLRSGGKSYRLYSLVYPFFWLVSKLDHLIPARHGYAVVVAGRKPEASTSSSPGQAGS